jgi:hypothetical protein
MSDEKKDAQLDDVGGGFGTTPIPPIDPIRPPTHPHMPGDPIKEKTNPTG